MRRAPLLRIASSSLFVLAVAACGSSGGGGITRFDLSQPPDMVADAARDSAVPPDQGIVDGAMPDMVAPIDLTVLPDLLIPPDLSIPPDFAVPPISPSCPT